MWFLWVLLAVPMAVIVSLAFHIPQADELEKRVKKMENELEKKVTKIWKDSTTFKKTKLSKK